MAAWGMASNVIMSLECQAGVVVRNTFFQDFLRIEVKGQRGTIVLTALSKIQVGVSPLENYRSHKMVT